MGVPPSEVGYTSASTGRETTKSVRDMWWHWIKKIISGEYSIHGMDEAFIHVLVEERERNRLSGWHRRGWKDKLKIILQKF
jgi:hypothetical protein